MKIKLTVEERAFALVIPIQTRGDITAVRKSLQALEVLEFTEEEKLDYGITEGLGTGFAWAPHSRDEITTIEMKPPVLRWWLQEAKAYREWPTRPCVATLFEKMEAAKKEAEEED